MKAVVIHATGGPEQLVVADLPDPVPGPGEVLIDVAYAGCNWADTQVRMGIYPHPMVYPLVMGFEVSGTVAALGPDVASVKVGDPVATFPEKGGGYAEKCLAPAAGLIKLPADFPLDIGAAFPIQALTAYHMLFTVYRLRRGDTRERARSHRTSSRSRRRRFDASPSGGGQTLATGEKPHHRETMNDENA